MRSWLSLLSLNGTTDGVFRALFLFIAFVIIIYYSSLIERPYHQKLAQLYVHPWWRLLIILLVLTAALWCPRVGILVGCIIFMYFNDMNTLIRPLPHLS